MAYPHTFNCAGVSRYKGQVKVRFANGLERVKVYVKADQPEIELVELPNEMSRVEAVKYLATTELMNNPEYAEAIQETIAKYEREIAADLKRAAKANGEVVKKEKPAKTPKATAEPSLEAIKARAKKTKEAKEPEAS